MRKWTLSVLVVALLLIVPASYAGDQSDGSSLWSQVWSWVVAAFDGDQEPPDEIGPTIIPSGLEDASDGEIGPTIIPSG